MSHPVPTNFVDHIPDLMTWDDYRQAPGRKLVRFQLRMTEQGLEIVGDSPHPDLLDALLSGLDPAAIERMLCG